MDVNSTSAAGASLTGTQVSAKEGLDATLNQFLLMLTTQLQNQDPLDPLETAEFTGQLIGFSTVEQLIASNQKLDELIAAQEATETEDSGSTVSPLDFIGKEVEVAGTGFGYQGDPVTLSYGLDKTYAAVSFTIVDSLGQTVWQSAEMPTTADLHEVVWDGTDSNGDEVDPGVYYMDVRAVDGDGLVTLPDTFITGLVTGVDTSTDTPLLQIGDYFVTLGDVTAVRMPAASDDA